VNYFILYSNEWYFALHSILDRKPCTAAFLKHLWVTGPYSTSHKVTDPSKRNVAIKIWIRSHRNSNRNVWKAQEPFRNVRSKPINLWNHVHRPLKSPSPSSWAFTDSRLSTRGLEELWKRCLGLAHTSSFSIHSARCQILHCSVDVLILRKGPAATVYLQCETKVASQN